MSGLSSPTTLLAAQRLRWNILGLVIWWLTVRSDLWVTVVRLINTIFGWKHTSWNLYVGKPRFHGGNITFAEYSVSYRT